MRLPWAMKWSKKKAASLEAATASVQQSALPLFFCFGCREIISSRPCDACDRETEIFVVTTETDRRLLLGRLPSEAA